MTFLTQTSDKCLIPDQNQTEQVFIQHLKVGCQTLDLAGRRWRIDVDPVSRSLMRGQSSRPLQPVWVNTADMWTWAPPPLNIPHQIPVPTVVPSLSWPSFGLINSPVLPPAAEQ